MNEINNNFYKRFQQTQFLISANGMEHLPKTQIREVAFAGRSNAGKSSALNVITSQGNLARISKTPGRTQLINYFSIDEQNCLVDLPGYGYAKVPETIRLHWQKILQQYFEKRESLVGLIMLMDIRHPLTSLDQQMLKWCEARGLPTHILLTKADKLKKGPAKSTLLQVQTSLKSFKMPISIQLFSAPNKEGLDEVWTVLNNWLPITT